MAQRERIVELNSIDENHIALVGSKAMGLARLGRMGLAVPDEGIPHLEFSLGRMLLRTPGVLFRILTYTAGAGAFLRHWETFMARHGHHCRGEMELGNVRWSEEPDYVLSTVRNYLGGLGQANPLANYSRYAEERDYWSRRS